MAMNRRRFLGLGTAALAAAATFDPERLLWTPGQRTFFLPSARQRAFMAGDFVVYRLNGDQQYRTSEVLYDRVGHVVEARVLVPTSNLSLMNTASHGHVGVVTGQEGHETEVCIYSIKGLLVRVG